MLDDQLLAQVHLNLGARDCASLEFVLGGDGDVSAEADVVGSIFGVCGFGATALLVVEDFLFVVGSIGDQGSLVGEDLSLEVVVTCEEDIALDVDSELLEIIG